MEIETFDNLDLESGSDEDYIVSQNELLERIKEIKISTESTIKGTGGVKKKSLKNNEIYSKKLKAYAENGKVKDVTVCLKMGGDPCFEECYALKMACFNGHLPVVKQLLDFKHRNNKLKYKFDYALTWCAKNGHYDVFKMLIKNGANMNLLKKVSLRDYSTIRHRAIIIYLINNGININTNYRFLLEHCQYKVDSILFGDESVDPIEIKNLPQDLINLEDYEKCIEIINSRKNLH
jgi:hypothetical protein